MTHEEMAQRLDAIADTLHDILPDHIDIPVLRAGAAALRAMEWRPIGEAPKDLTHVDLWVTWPFRLIEPMRVPNCYWDEFLGRWAMRQELDSGYVITHYRELPAPPKERV